MLRKIQQKLLFLQILETIINYKKYFNDELRR